MLHRHAISDANWDRIKDLLPGRPSHNPAGRPRDNRLFVDAVLWIAKTGAPWRDLPERFGNWNSVWRRLDRWARKGTWRLVFEALQDPDLEWLILDSTVIRAHPCAAGGPVKKLDGTGGQEDQSLGRSRGGFGTKVHVAGQRPGVAREARADARAGGRHGLEAKTLDPGRAVRGGDRRPGLRQPGRGGGRREERRRGRDPVAEEPEGATGVRPRTGTRIGTWWSVLGQDEAHLPAGGRGTQRRPPGTFWR